MVERDLGYCLPNTIKIIRKDSFIGPDKQNPDTYILILCNYGQSTRDYSNVPKNSEEEKMFVVEGMTFNVIMRKEYQKDLKVTGLFPFTLDYILSTIENIAENAIKPQFRHDLLMDTNQAILSGLVKSLNKQTITDKDNETLKKEIEDFAKLVYDWCDAL